MHRKPLTSIYGRYERRSNSLKERFRAKLPRNSEEREVCEPVHQDGRAYLIVRLQQLWGEFCRELIVRSAMGGCLTRNGLILPKVPGVRRVSDINTVIKLKDLAGPGSKWEEPAFAVDQAIRLTVANLHGIDLGLGQASVVADNIKSIRNYIVHPNRSNKVRYAHTTMVLGFRGLPPDELLFQAVPGGETVFENWLSTLTRAAWDAVA